MRTLTAADNTSTGGTRCETPKRAMANGRKAELTVREQEVLEWIAEGKRNGEIAQILGISVFTVGKHVQNILKKLGVENRTAASRYAPSSGRKGLKRRK